jgi:hypothetical protein
MMNNFKVGDKVVRKKEFQAEFPWGLGEQFCTVSVCYGDGTFELYEDKQHLLRDEEKFELDKEPEMKPNPKRLPCADVIHAWAEGAEIEVYDYHDKVWTVTKSPSWSDTFSYRIKPKKVTKQYRMAKTIDGVIAVDVTNSTLDDPAEYNVEGFISWIGGVTNVVEEVK